MPQAPSPRGPSSAVGRGLIARDFRDFVWRGLDTAPNVPNSSDSDAEDDAEDDALTSEQGAPASIEVEYSWGG